MDPRSIWIEARRKRINLVMCSFTQWLMFKPVLYRSITRFSFFKRTLEHTRLIYKTLQSGEWHYPTMAHESTLRQARLTIVFLLTILASFLLDKMFKFCRINTQSNVDEEVYQNIVKLHLHLSSINIFLELSNDIHCRDIESFTM